MSEEATVLGRLFEKARVKRGDTHQDAWIGVYERLGPYAPTPETIRQYHHGVVKTPDAVVVLALADFYGLKLRRLPRLYADVGERLTDVLVRMSCWDLGIPGRDVYSRAS